MSHDVEIRNFRGIWTESKTRSRLMQQARIQPGSEPTAHQEKDLVILTFASEEAARTFVTRLGGHVRLPDQEVFVQLRTASVQATQAGQLPAGKVVGQPTAGNPRPSNRKTAKVAAKRRKLPPTNQNQTPVKVQSRTDRLYELPYNFVPILRHWSPTAPTTTHERSFHDAAGRVTGELLLELTALTPLLAANSQTSLQRLSEMLPVQFGAPVRNLFKRLGGTLHDQQVEPEKKVLEPMCLPSPGATPGPVLIPGAALKGMLRHAVGALVNSPMERVARRRFSYRPHIALGALREVKVALVVKGGGRDPEGNPREVEVLLRRTTDLAYIRDDVMDSLPKSLRERLQLSAQARANWFQNLSSPSDLVSQYGLTPQEARAIDQEHPSIGFSRGKILKRNGPTGAIELQSSGHWLPVCLFNGSDLKAVLNTRFHERNPSEVATRSRGGYPYGLVNLRGARQRVTLDREVLEQFYSTLETLGDSEAGHLRDHPLLHDEPTAHIRQMTSRLAELHHRGLQPGDVIFVEQYEQQASAPVALGFRGRTAYRDDLHLTSDPEYSRRDLQAADGPSAFLRDVLSPRPIEQQVDSRGCPVGLSLTRSLFGYVGSPHYSDQQPLVFGIGIDSAGNPTDFSQLSGRISFNFAVEQLEPNRPRFLALEQGCLVPLRPLGSPQPSAVENYLTQTPERLANRVDGGILCTYGDTWDDRSAGDLRGRKFYLHQSDAASDSRCYQMTEKPHPQGVVREDHFKLLLGGQTSIGRFISTTGTRFRCTLRFSELEKWELGAIVLALAPTLARVERLCEALSDPTATTSLQEWIKAARSDQAIRLAHKLGHGRPLGLGSVAFQIQDAITLAVNPRQQDGPGKAVLGVEVAHQPIPHADLELWLLDAIGAFGNRMKTEAGDQLRNWVSQVLCAWLEVHRFSGTSKQDYMRSGGKIFSFHSEMRKEHATGRKNPRQAPDQNEVTLRGLKPASPPQ